MYSNIFLIGKRIKVTYLYNENFTSLKVGDIGTIKEVFCDFVYVNIDGKTPDENDANANDNNEFTLFKSEYEIIEDESDNMKEEFHSEEKTYFISYCHTNGTIKQGYIYSKIINFKEILTDNDLSDLKKYLRDVHKLQGISFINLSLLK